MSHASRRKWTVDEDDRLRKLWMDGAIRERIAAALGRSLQSVDGRRRFLRLHSREVHRPGATAFSESVGAQSNSFHHLRDIVGKSRDPHP